VSSTPNGASVGAEDTYTLRQTAANLHITPPSLSTTSNHSTAQPPAVPAKNTTAVELRRGAKGFGFSIRGGWEFDHMPLFVLRIADDGPAAEDGRLRVGDQLIEINGESTVGMSHETAIQLIKVAPTVRLVLRRDSVERELRAESAD